MNALGADAARQLGKSTVELQRLEEFIRSKGGELAAEKEECASLQSQIQQSRRKTEHMENNSRALTLMLEELNEKIAAVNEDVRLTRESLLLQLRNRERADHELAHVARKIRETSNRVVRDEAIRERLTQQRDEASMNATVLRGKHNAAVRSASAQRTQLSRLRAEVQKCGATSDFVTSLLS